MSDFLADPDEVKEYSPRFRLMYVVIVCAIAIFAVRLWYLQIVKGSELRLFSEKNRIKETEQPAPRGMILDRGGKILVDNRPGFIAKIVPQYVEDLDAIAKVLSEKLDIPAATIVQKVKSSRRKNGAYWPVKIKDALTMDEVARLEPLKIDYPGLDVEMAITRSYHMERNGSHLFGYVSEISEYELARVNRNRAAEDKLKQGDIVGKSGLEHVFDHELRGVKGLEFVQVDAHGRAAASQDTELLQGMPEFIEAEPGQNITLTIDADVQAAAYKSITENKRIGAVVAMSPKTGEVLAWLSAPSYDPNEFSQGISPKLWTELVNDPFQVLRNKVIQTHTPPGSTFKAIVALAALQERVVTPASTYHCPGFMQFGRRRYHCHLRQGHGAVNVYKALEQSCDVYFYRVGIALGIDRIAKYATMLGLGAKTGIGLPGEVPGLVPTTDWKKRALGEEWQPGENLSNAIGQGFMLASPIQLVQAFSIIGTEGKVHKPFVVKKIVGLDEKVVLQNEPQFVKQVADISPENFKIVKKGLQMVNNGERGTAKWWKIPGIEMAGKTGTVQLFSLSADQVFAKCDARPMRQRHHGWYVGYAPANDPEIAVAVLAEHACAGSSGGGPIARDVMQAYFQKFHPDWIKPEKGQAKAQPAKVEPELPAPAEGEE
ncbi:MAG TPA: penicillin-binding protein 2 [Bdellovibrionales bacterium]|nr:penicillin-binding protein 2 [Bdellovibrionales bacterium]